MILLLIFPAIVLLNEALTWFEAYTTRKWEERQRYEKLINNNCAVEQR